MNGGAWNIRNRGGGAYNPECDPDYEEQGAASLLKKSHEVWTEQRAILAPLAEDVKRHLSRLESLVKELEQKGCTIRYYFNGEELHHRPDGNFDFEIRMSIATELQL